MPDLLCRRDLTPEFPDTMREAGRHLFEREMVRTVSARFDRIEDWPARFIHRSAQLDCDSHFDLGRGGALAGLKFIQSIRQAVFDRIEHNATAGWVQIPKHRCKITIGISQESKSQSLDSDFVLGHRIKHQRSDRKCERSAGLGLPQTFQDCAVFVNLEGAFDGRL